MLNIRDVCKDDLNKGLFEIFSEGYNLHYTNRKDKFYKKSDDELREVLLEMFNNNKVIVIEENNKIVGYVCYEIKEKVSKILWINEIVISSNYRNKGYCKLLINYLEDVSKRENCSAIELCCWEFNKDAKEIYKHLGFTKQRTIFERKKHE